MEPLVEVDHLVDDDKFRAMARPPDQLKIEPYAACADVARAPSGLHPLDPILGHRYRARRQGHSNADGRPSRRDILVCVRLRLAQ